MSQSIVRPDNRRPLVNRIDPNRLAWGVMLLAFALFCVICVFIVIGIDFYMFQSTVSMTSTLSVGLGSVTVTDLANPTERVGRSGMILPKGVVVSTDATQQGTIRFTNGPDQLFAVVTLHRNASVTLLESARPRFDWSRSSTEITMDNVVGKVDIDVPASIDRSIRISARTPAGAIVNFEKDGSYIIEAASEQLRVFNREGKANIISPDLQGGRDIPADGLGIVNYVDNSVELRQGYVDLVLDKNFQTTQSNEMGAGAESVWTCGSDPGDSPAGLYELMSFDGVPALRFSVETMRQHMVVYRVCKVSGRPALKFQTILIITLVMRAKFYIENQSLGACGTEGSECPLMLRMDYIDADGEAQKWFHGFYARAQNPYPLRCATCPQDHERVNEQAWYTYESPNLRSFFKPEAGEASGADLTPRTIVALWIYASGHQFDVRIGEVALIAAQLESEVVPGSSGS